MSSKKNREILRKSSLTSFLRKLLNVRESELHYSNPLDYDNAYRKRLKFQHVTDWKRFRASMDLIDDTEEALLEAFKYKLGNKGTEERIGEMYVRLYGILNAVYLQIYAIVEITNLLQFKSGENIEKKFKSLDVFRLRNIAGSHTVNYQYPDKEQTSKPDRKRKTSFRIVQMHLEKTGSRIQAVDENGGILEFNLIKCLHEYEKIARDLLIQLAEHGIRSLVIKKEDRLGILEQLNETIKKLVDYNNLDELEKFERNRKRQLLANTKKRRLSFPPEVLFDIHA